MASARAPSAWIIFLASLGTSCVAFSPSPSSFTRIRLPKTFARLPTEQEVCLHDAGNIFISDQEISGSLSAPCSSGSDSKSQHLSRRNTKRKHSKIPEILTGAGKVAAVLVAASISSFVAHPSPSLAADPPRFEILQETSLADSVEFRSLRRERPMKRALQELNKLKDLQDSRLEQCADTGIFWEQCFLYGESEGMEVGGSDALIMSKKAEAGGPVEKMGSKELEEKLRLTPNLALDPMALPNTSPQKSKIPTW